MIGVIIESYMIKVIIMKSIVLLILLIIGSNIYGQSIKSKDQYGEIVAYIDGNEFKVKNRYSKTLYYFDGQQIHQQNQYGKVLYYMDGNEIKLSCILKGQKSKIGVNTEKYSII